MAQTRAGVTFSLVRATAPSTEPADLVTIVRRTVRGSDAVVPAAKGVYAVIAGDASGVGACVGRLKRSLGSGARLSVVAEPFGKDERAIAARVIDGDIAVRVRARKEELVEGPSGDLVARADLARLYGVVREQAWHAEQRARALEDELRSVQMQLELARVTPEQPKPSRGWRRKR